MNRIIRSRLRSSALVLPLLSVLVGYPACGNDDHVNQHTGQEGTGCPGSDVVHFPDPNLELVIRETIEKPGGELCVSDLSGLMDLYVSGRSISDLGGLEHCIGLQWLYLDNNQITDLGPLAGLTGLSELDLCSNQITLYILEQQWLAPFAFL